MISLLIVNMIEYILKTNEWPGYLDTDAPRALPEDGHSPRVSTKLVNVGADPLQSQVLVTQTHVTAVMIIIIIK